ncbi:outer envelope membrane protein 7 [Herrania umbratica]|uniref:Outer envelope membrane protein 7 n=1 Tax=Herrania umbratica TaxID=108875 RepID=A0A6J1B6C4_9ROSI|nr:outer envelope membrane protein 7 [Herrania umbratica]
MAAITSAVIAIAGVVLGWIAIEIACKPCLEKGREAIDRSLNPDYDPDDDNDNNVRAPLNPYPDLESKADNDTSPSTSIKAV